MTITFNGIISEAIIVIAIAISIYIILKITKLLLKIVVAVIINSILGFILIELLNYFFQLGIKLSAKLLIPVSVFGLPGAGTIILIKILQISI
ncbi:MAG: pro-sigmaK processing inhibitor BofA family protein [Candidatus Micrarchaeaceae archaeon]